MSPIHNTNVMDHLRRHKTARPPTTIRVLTRHRDASTQVAFENASCDEDTSHRSSRSNCCCRPKTEDDRASGLLHCYLQSATIHGIAQSTGPKHYWLRRPIWLILIIVMTISLSITLYKEMALLYEYPVKTVSQVSLRTELTFPAVTICNLNQYIRERVPDIPIIQHAIYLQSEYSQWTNHLNRGNRTPDLDSMADVSGEELKNIMGHAAPRMEDFLLMCAWESKKFNCTGIFRFINTDLGRCVVFNGPESGTTPDQVFNATGTWSELRVIAHTQNNSSYYSSLIHAGVKVVVHEPEHAPYPRRQGWYLRPGVTASIALKRMESRGLPRPYKAYSNNYCEDTKAADYVNSLSSGLDYSEFACFEECVLKGVHERCGCKHYRTSVQFRTVEQLRSCHCPKECETVEYSADLSYADFASHFIEQQATKDLVGFMTKDLLESIVDIRITFKTLNVHETIQEPLLTRSSVLGSLGGKMGLFLGASILSITELAEILLLLLVRAVKRCGPWAARRCSVSPHVQEKQ